MFIIVYILKSYIHIRFSLTFSTVDRTVCPIWYNKNLEDSNPPPLFYIDVFTSSVDPQPYSLMIEPVENFILEYVVLN